jgi:hypothetical protein
MIKIVYYPDCGDVFDIHLLGGISYYIIEKRLYELKSVTNKSMLQSEFNSRVNRKLNNLLFNNLDNMIHKFGEHKNVYDTYSNTSGEYKCIVCHMVNTNAGSSTSHTFNSNGKLLVLSTVIVSITMPNSNNYLSLYQNNTKEECLSFKSFLDTRLVRFMIYIGTVASSLRNEETWRFVPDPQDWSVIYEDRALPDYTPDEYGIYKDKDGNKHCSLYAKYKLSDDEIKTIEIVIKERKG